MGGLGVALYLGMLGLLKLPCPGGGCSAILHSRWSAVLGVPVGFWGAAAWLLVLGPSVRLRVAAHHALALGSVVFVALQAFVIGRFCPWCLLHAALCWLAWPWRRATGFPRLALPAGLALAAGLLAVSWSARQTPASVGAESAARLSAAGFDWLGAEDDAGVAVLSLTCPLCLDLLATTPSPDPAAPRLVFLVSAENRALTEMLVGAVLAHPAGGEESFPVLAALLVEQRELVLADPAAAAEWLAFVQPEARAFRREASGRLKAQQDLLAAMDIAVTPVRVDASGTVETFQTWP